ncbi:MAG: STAS domain-containing protein [Acidobacteriota bacterium]
MRLVTEKTGDVHLIRVKEDRLAYPMLAAFQDEVRRLVDTEGARKLVIDLKEVAYVDSATIGCLIDIYRLLREKQGTLKLSGLQKRVETVLSMTGVHKVLEIHGEASEAVAAFGAPARRKRG